MMLDAYLAWRRSPLHTTQEGNASASSTVKYSKSICFLITPLLQSHRTMPATMIGMYMCFSVFVPAMCHTGLLLHDSECSTLLPSSQKNLSLHPKTVPPESSACVYRICRILGSKQLLTKMQEASMEFSTSSRTVLFYCRLYLLSVWHDLPYFPPNSNASPCRLTLKGLVQTDVSSPYSGLRHCQFPSS